MTGPSSLCLADWPGCWDTMSGGSGTITRGLSTFQVTSRRSCLIT
uniref:Uncharacterized protein n=1 Tax=Arundo donax TaxID=35708 RepID=A0A0A9B3E9_ARUDO